MKERREEEVQLEKREVRLTIMSFKQILFQFEIWLFKYSSAARC